MDDPQMQTTLNIPSLVIFGIISVFAIRYFFFGGSAAAQAHASSPSASSASGRRHVPYEKIEMVASMFPQLSRRDIEWDLLRNGGSVQSTSEKMLREGRLDAAPPNFRAQQAPASASSQATATNGSQRRRAVQSKSEHQDLITRYGLSAQVAEMASKVAAEAQRAEGEAGSGGGGGEVIQSKAMQKEKGGWTGNKEQRQALLKKRRDEMILAARRRMEEQDRAGKV